MICRLCLENLDDNERALLLFEEDEDNAFGETKFVKMIAKYLQLQLSEDDSISGKLCNKCVRHLEEFDNFAQLVEQKQSTLRNEFLEIKCEANWSETDDDDEGDEDNAYGDYADLETERKHMSRLMAHMQNQLDERAISLDKLPVAPEKYTQKPLMSDAAVSSDDDVPLHELRKKRKTKTRGCQQNTKKTRKTSKPPKPKSEPLLPTTNEESTEPAVGESTGKRINLSEITKKNEQLIASHMKLICELCSTICETFSKLKTHFNSEHHEKKAYVKCCNNTYDRPSRLVEHIKWHKDPDTYKCHICDKRLRGKSCLDVHIETKHNEPTDAGKSRDKSNDNSDSDLTCPKCPRKFRTQLFFKKHVEKHESGQEQKYDCNICGKCFINIHRLRRHIESIHEDLHPHVCDICGKKFKFKPSFERHLLEHQGIYDEPLQCQECGDWLKNEHTFRLHRFKHQKEEIACTYCGKICITRTALRGHISYMHKEKPLLQCKYCEKSFKEKKNYNEHVAVHTGALLYACQHCSKEFRSKANMYVHVKRYHVEEWLNAKMARSNDPNLKTTATTGGQ